MSRLDCIHAFRRIPPQCTLRANLAGVLGQRSPHSYRGRLSREALVQGDSQRDDAQVQPVLGLEHAGALVKRLHGRSNGGGRIRVYGCSPGCLIVSLLLSLFLTLVINLLIRAF
jgi:hypothetical protein